jgi:glycosyltransferase involved in cell wall biosynthesis
MLLVVGNHYQHKYLAATANALARAFADRAVVAFGLEVSGGASDPDDVPSAQKLARLPNLTGRRAGQMEEADLNRLYASATAIIFPSHAEGFGFPTLQALAVRRPLFARRLPATEEIWLNHGCDPNIHFYDTTAELIELLRAPPDWQDSPPPPRDGGAPRSAAEIGAALTAAIAAVSYERIVARVQAMQFASDIAKTGRVELDDPPAEAARLLAHRIEALARRAFARPLVFRATRIAVRSGRAVRRMLRRAR